MPQIELLDQQTIDKIAAGEVIERPSSVVKELVENAIDAKATAVTVEIKEGGKSFIRITDNGCGIDKEQVRIAFLRHSTSKIKAVEDLLTVSSLGFRGEALSSIAAVAHVELITKTLDAVSGVRYCIEGSKETAFEEIGAPEGTTFIIRDLFFNTPARQKFLKSATTEAGYINALLERLALSHPEISFKFITNGQVRLQTSGNGNKKDIIYHIYGKDIARNLIEVQYTHEHFKIKGFIGKPLISRGNRNYENYYINARYIKSNLISKGIEEAYKPYMMQHQYPFTVLYFEIEKSLLDINVHPTKMELRFQNSEELYHQLCEDLRNSLSKRELIPEVSVDQTRMAQKKPVKDRVPEPFEKKRMEEIAAAKAAIAREEGPRIISSKMGMASRRSEIPPQPPITDALLQQAKEQAKSIQPIIQGSPDIAGKEGTAQLFQPENRSTQHAEQILQPLETVGKDHAKREGQTQLIRQDGQVQEESRYQKQEQEIQTGTQMSFLSSEEEKGLLHLKNQASHRIIGQFLDTYWLVEFEEKLYIIDQHAAHEKVLFERTMRTLREREFTSQNLCPPIILTLNMQEEELLKRYLLQFTQLGFEIEHFGGKEYCVCAVPDNLFGIDGQKLMMDMLDGLSELHGRETSDLVLEKVASMSCKAAVKGHDHLSEAEVKELIQELFQLENPYNCPHGRPTIISMTKYELERKFKRIV